MASQRDVRGGERSVEAFRQRADGECGFRHKFPDRLEQPFTRVWLSAAHQPAVAAEPVVEYVEGDVAFAVFLVPKAAAAEDVADLRKPVQKPCGKFTMDADAAVACG